MSLINKLRYHFEESVPLRLSLKTIALCIISLQLSCIEEKEDPILAGAITGIVISKATNVPLEGVEVTTAPATTIAHTDSQGKFRLANVPEGDYTVVMQIDGYDRENTKVKVVRNATTNVDVRLAVLRVSGPAPEGPLPANGQGNQPLTVALRWSVPKTTTDVLQYTVDLYEAQQTVPFLEAAALADTSLQVNGLKFNTTYYWQVGVLSSTGHVTYGDLWLFKTIPFPDNRIVFSARKNGSYEIFSAGAAGDSIAQLTSTSHFELKPQFSTNRDLIAYSSNANIDYHIYLMTNQGTQPVKVTTLPIAGFHNPGIGFSWSPDNGSFVYSHYDNLYRINRNGADLTLIAKAPANRNFRSCHWTAVNNKIVVETVGPLAYDSEIYIMNANGTDQVMLVGNLPGVIENPSFSIDGREVMFTHDLSGFESEDGRQLDAHIFTINIETGELVDVSGEKPDGTNDLQPRFSPDGASIVFTNASNDGTGKKSIWVIKRDGLVRQLLIEDAEMPHWQ